MPILLVTARNAEKSVNACVKGLGVPARIHVCDADVAALLSLEKIAAELSGADLGDVSEIIIPGTIAGDASVISDKTGKPCFKGPRHIADLPAALRAVSEKRASLSCLLPADEMLGSEISAEMARELLLVRERPAKYSMKIGKKKPVYLGAGISSVIAEINGAPGLKERDLLDKAAYYVSSGADIVDIGMVSDEDNSKKIGGMVDSIRSRLDVPLSVDTLNEKELLAAADAGVDLVLSVDLSNSAVLGSISVPAVVIPRGAKGDVPASPAAKISLLRKVLRAADMKKVILDPLLAPLNFGFSDSVDSYIQVRKAYPGTPMMMGAGNVTEMLDADSPGVNALLAGIASELGIDLLFTTEGSVKTRGCVRELSTASKMMYLSKKRNQAPKDLGLDLLVLKDKRMKAPPPDELKGVKSVRARAAKPCILEDAEFRIYVYGDIAVICYKADRPFLKFSGRSARDLYSAIIGRGLLKDPSHAAYLGRELSKAEIALSLGKDYVQDEDLF